MRAVVAHAAKDLRVDTIPDAAPPGAGEVRVKIAAGGICGSDMHYYRHGGFGVVRIKEPMILGHEIAGTIADIGDGVSGLAVGDKVAVNPSQPCGTCSYCQRGMRNQCLDMRFLGSAMRMPHVQGGFREFMTVPAAQAVKVPEHVSLAEAAVCEPLAVCLHAGMQAGPLMGRRVLVTGAGPIGALCTLVARLGGAVEVIATDIADAPLAIARKLGAGEVVNTAKDPGALDGWKADKGHFDVLFEASGNQQALVSAFDVLKPGAVLVQVGLGGEMTLPVNTIVAKEFQMRGTFRFDREFELAVQLLAGKLIDVKPLITATLPFARAVEAFELAGDRSQSMKVQLAF
jgi:L-idonate 5-dehydrogenase